MAVMDGVKQGSMQVILPSCPGLTLFVVNLFMAVRCVCLRLVRILVRKRESCDQNCQCFAISPNPFEQRNDLYFTRLFFLVEDSLTRMRLMTFNKKYVLDTFTTFMSKCAHLTL